MQELFKAAVERGASDIRIKAGDFMRAPINGELQPLTQQKLTVEQVKGIALQLIPHQKDRDNFDTLLDYDCSFGIPGVGRFRVNILKQRGSPMIVMRAIPIEIPSVEDLGLPPIVNKIAAFERGDDSRDGRNGFRKELDDGRDDQLDEQQQAAPHRHAGEPDRIPPSRQQMLDHSA
jgi:twitching motility protein PilT